MSDERQYIAQCDCPEIQDGWEPENGDLMCQRSSISEKHKWALSVVMVGVHGRFHMRNFIFLPSIKQLLKMIDENSIDASLALWDYWRDDSGGVLDPREYGFKGMSLKELLLDFIKHKRGCNE